MSGNVSREVKPFGSGVPVPGVHDAFFFDMSHDGKHEKNNGQP